MSLCSRVLLVAGIGFALPSLAGVARVSAQVWTVSAETPNFIASFVRVSAGRQVEFKSVGPASPGRPIFLLLPGVNRNFSPTDVAPLALAREGYGVAIAHFSAQPESIATLPRGEKAGFDHRDYTLTDMASEIEAVAAHLKRIHPGSEIIPVSLSYSGAVSRYIQGFSIVVDVVPMTSSAAARPELESYRQSLKAAEAWNPVLGPSITRSLLDTSYRQHWTGVVDSALRQSRSSSERRSEMLSGYIAMSRASEGFAWSPEQGPQASRRVFVLASGESKSLLEHQIETFFEVQKNRPDSLLFVVAESGHILPSDQPLAYAWVLDIVGSGKLGNQAAVVFLKPSTNESEVMTLDQARSRLQELL